MLVEPTHILAHSLTLFLADCRNASYQRVGVTVLAVELVGGVPLHTEEAPMKV